MSILRERLFRSSAKHRLAKEPSSLCIAQEKLRDGATKELHGVGQAMEALLSNFGHAVRHAQEVASHAKVGLQVHQLKLAAYRAELAIAAMLQSRGAALQVDQDSEDHEVDSKVLATARKGGPGQNTLMEGERLAKLIHATKVQQSFAGSTLEACVAQRQSLVEVAQKSLEAVAQTVPHVDERVAIGDSNSTVSSHALDCSCDEPWNPFDSDLMEVVGNAMILKSQDSFSTLDTTVGSCISQHESDTSCANPCVTSSLPEECAKNPFDMDCAELVNTTGQPWAPSSKNHVLEEWLNNPFTEDFAKAADAEQRDQIPREDGIVQLVHLSRGAFHRAPSSLPPFSL